MHTPLCRHALGEPEEYADTGLGVGLKGVTFTCHSPMPDGFWPRVRMREGEIGAYVGMVERAADAYAGRVEVRLGMESDYFVGMESWLEDLHGSHDFHHVLGSIHYFAPEYMELHGGLSIDDFRRQYFADLVASAESGLFDTLAHPDLVKNAEPESWDVEKAMPYIEEALDAIAATGVAMELNTSGLHKRIPEMNPGPEILKAMADRDIPVVIGSDSHRPYRVGANFSDALELIEDAGFSEVSYFIDRQRIDLPIDEARGGLDC